MARAKEAAGGSLDKEQQRAALAQFWHKVDEDLAKRREEATRESMKPASQRIQGDVALEGLTAALEFDPYKK